MNSKMVKSEIVVLIEKEKANANVLLPRCYRLLAGGQE
jgi:hypothetical protein